MDSVSFGLTLSVSVSWFDRKNKISLIHQTSIEDLHNDKTYKVNNKYHRANGPAYVRYKYFNSAKIIIYESYCKNTELHRVDGPAVIEYLLVNGIPKIVKKLYYDNGELHRVGGPAEINYNLVDGEMKLGYQLHVINGNYQYNI